MAGNPTSIETVVGAGAVAKADFRAHSDAGQVNVYADADALRATDATPQAVVFVTSLRRLFRRDPASVAADDGTAVIVDGNGNRWLATGVATSASAEFVATRAALAAIDTAEFTAAYLEEDGREGVFLWDASDLSATLLGSAIASSAVNATTETITSVAHGLHTGDAAVTTTAVNGLALQTIYYVIKVDADNFRLADTYALAVAGTPVDLTGTTAVTVHEHLDPLTGVYVTADADADITGAAGAWVRQVSGPVDIRWFGAASDSGTTDNTPALHAAQKQLPADGGTIFVPAAAGFYELASDFYLDQKNRLVGEGVGSFLTGDGAAVIVDAISDPETRPYWAIERIRIDRSGTAGPAVQLLGQAGSGQAPIRSVIRDLFILSSTGHGLQSKGAYLIDMYSPLITGCADTGLWLGRDDAETVGPNAWCVFGGEIVANDKAVHIDTALGISFFGTAIEGNTTEGVDIVQSGRHVGFYNCYFEANGGFDIRTGATAGGSYALTVIGCNMFDGSVNKDYAIILNASSLLTSIIENTTFSTYVVAGISVGASVVGSVRQCQAVSGTPALVSAWTKTFRRPLDEAVLSATITFDWPSVAAGASDTRDFTVTGAAVGDLVIAAAIGAGTTLDGVQVTAWVSATNTVSITLTNHSVGAVDLASMGYRFIVLPAANWGL
jgi:hypothetical protein